MGTPWDSATKHGTRLSTAMSHVVDSHSHESVHSHMSRVMSPSEVRPTNLQRAQSRATGRGRRSSSREASSVEGYRGRLGEGDGARRGRGLSLAKCRSPQRNVLGLCDSRLGKHARARQEQTRIDPPVGRCLPCRLNGARGYQRVSKGLFPHANSDLARQGTAARAGAFRIISRGPRCKWSLLK